MLARLLLFSATLSTLAAPQADTYRESRERLVSDSIQRYGLRNPDVIRAFRETPRHEFMPEDVRRFAYEDRAVPIGHEQTISQPSLVAAMTEMLDVQKNHRVLEIGTGSGYQAAILSRLAKEVYTIEIVPALAKSAAETFRRLGYRNIFAREGNGYLGWPEKAPFDRIILTAAPPELPQTLVDQLRPGGKLVAPVGSTPWEQELILVEKSKDGKVTRRSMLKVGFVPMVRKPGVSK
jgi:protein-L-isoaspartate(D-aspartate) O-methyltransferase